MRLSKEDKLSVEFYRSGAVDKVLKKYKFTDKELEIIHRAIRTAKRDNPNMELIRRADNLLSLVAKTRTPIHTLDAQEELEKGLASAFKLEQEMRRVEEENRKKKERKKLFRYIMIALSILSAISTIYSFTQ